LYVKNDSEWRWFVCQPTSLSIFLNIYIKEMYYAIVGITVD